MHYVFTILLWRNNSPINLCNLFSGRAARGGLTTCASAPTRTPDGKMTGRSSLQAFRIENRTTRDAPNIWILFGHFLNIQRQIKIQILFFQLISPLIFIKFKVRIIVQAGRIIVRTTLFQRTITRKILRFSAERSEALL